MNGQCLNDVPSLAARQRRGGGKWGFSSLNRIDKPAIGIKMVINGALILGRGWKSINLANSRRFSVDWRLLPELCENCIEWIFHLTHSTICSLRGGWEGGVETGDNCKPLNCIFRLNTSQDCGAIQFPFSIKHLLPFPPNGDPILCFIMNVLLLLDYGLCWAPILSVNLRISSSPVLIPRLQFSLTGWGTDWLTDWLVDCNSTTDPLCSLYISLYISLFLYPFWKWDKGRKFGRERESGSFASHPPSKQDEKEN